MESRIDIVGNLVAPPEKKDLPNNGGLVVNFTLVVQKRAYNDQTKEWHDKGDPSFYRCSVFNKRAINMIESQNLVPGTTLMVTGELYTQNYLDKETGAKRSSTNNVKVKDVGISFSNTSVTLPVRTPSNNGGGYQNNNNNGGGGGYQNNNGGYQNNGNNGGFQNQNQGSWNSPQADPWAAASQGNQQSDPWASRNDATSDEPPF